MPIWTSKAVLFGHRRGRPPNYAIIRHSTTPVTSFPSSTRERHCCPCKCACYTTESERTVTSRFGECHQGNHHGQRGRPPNLSYTPMCPRTQTSMTSSPTSYFTPEREPQPSCLSDCCELVQFYPHNMFYSAFFREFEPPGEFKYSTVQNFNLNSNSGSSDSACYRTLLSDQCFCTSNSTCYYGCDLSSVATAYSYSPSKSVFVNAIQNFRFSQFVTQYCKNSSNLKSNDNDVKTIKTNCKAKLNKLNVINQSTESSGTAGTSNNQLNSIGRRPQSLEASYYSSYCCVYNVQQDVHDLQRNSHPTQEQRRTNVQSHANVPSYSVVGNVIPWFNVTRSIYFILQCFLNYIKISLLCNIIYSIKRKYDTLYVDNVCRQLSDANVSNNSELECNSDISNINGFRKRGLISKSDINISEFNPEYYPDFNNITKPFTGELASACTRPATASAASPLPRPESPRCSDCLAKIRAGNSYHSPLPSPHQPHPPNPLINSNSPGQNENRISAPGWYRNQYCYSGRGISAKESLSIQYFSLFLVTKAFFNSLVFSMLTSGSFSQCSGCVPASPITPLLIPRKDCIKSELIQGLIRQQTSITVMTALHSVSEVESLTSATDTIDRSDGDTNVSGNSDADESETFSDSRNWFSGETPQRNRALSQSCFTMNTSPTSTPKKKKSTKRRRVQSDKYHPYKVSVDDELDIPHPDHDKSFLAVPSSMPSMRTMSPQMTPGQKLATRIRKVSEQSNCSQTQLSNQPLPKMKKKSSQKLIHDDGSYFLDRAATSRFHYIGSFLGPEQNESFMSDVDKLTHDDKNLRSKKISLAFQKEDNSETFNSSDSVSAEFTKFINHHSDATEKAVRSVFKIDVQFQTVFLKRLASMKDHIPYNSFSESGENTVVAVLTVGSLRTLSLKTFPGRKVTHQVPMHSGSLSVMSGLTQEKYEHSILKGTHEDNDVVCLILIGSTLSPEQQALSSYHPSTSQESSEKESASDGPGTDNAELVNISLFGPGRIPKILISDQANVFTELNSSSPESIDITAAANLMKDEVEAAPPEHKTSLMEKSEHDVADQTVIHECSSVNTMAFSNQLEGMERALMKTVNQVHKLSVEIVKLKDEVVSMSCASKKKGKDSSTAPPTPEKELVKLIEENRNIITSLHQQTAEMTEQIKVASQQATDVEETVQATRHELNQWHNSAFFREDSQLLKDLHDCISNGKLAIHIEASPQPPHLTSLSTEIANATAQQSTTPSRTPPPLLPISSLTSPGEENIVGHHESTPQQAAADDTSRRPTFVNMTESGTRLPSPTIAPQQSSPDTVPISSNTGRGDPHRPRAPPRTYVTVLITDSIMRQVPEDVLGTNHTLHIINKRNTDALSLPSLRSSLERIKPDFIYVHLGINDLFDRKTYNTVVSNYGTFHLFAYDKLPMSRVIISLPLPTDKPEECEVLENLHKSTCSWIDVSEGSKLVEDRHLHYNVNRNFRSQNWTPKSSLFSRDGIHLSDSGKEQMMKNFRFGIHSITRKIRLRNSINR